MLINYKLIKTGNLMMLLGGCILLLMANPVLAATWNTGDLFLGVSNGTYQVRDQAGVLKETLTTGRGGFTTGCAFDASQNLYVTEFSLSNVSVFDGPDDPHSNTLFGSGFSTPESVVFDSVGNVYVGNLGTGIDQYSSAGVLIKKVYAGKVDFFDIAADDDTIVYGTEGTSVYTVSISTGVSGPNFTTGTATNAYAMRILPDGGLLLADGVNIKRYNSAGVVIDTYDVSGEDTWFALNLDPDGTSFWSGGFGSSNYYKFDIDTGGVDSHIAGPFNTGTASSTFFGLCILGEPTAPANPLPTANAGPDQTVASGAPVTLDGSGSSANGPDLTLTYAWSQTGGTLVSLSSTTAQGPTFTAPVLVIGDADAILTFSLIVDNGFGPSLPDTVEITVEAPANTPPTANAGPDQTVASGALVTLDGSGSSANDPGQTLTYAWSQTGGTLVDLSSTTAQGPTFAAPILHNGDDDVVLTFSLIVNDGFDSSVADIVEITIRAPGAAPLNYKVPTLPMWTLALLVMAILAAELWRRRRSVK